MSGQPFAQGALFAGVGSGRQASLDVPVQPERERSPVVRVRSLECQFTLMGPAESDAVLVLADGRRVTLAGAEWDRLLGAFGAPAAGDRDAWFGRRVRIVDGVVWPAADGSADSGCTGSATSLFV